MQELKFQTLPIFERSIEVPNLDFHSIQNLFPFPEKLLDT